MRTTHAPNRRGFRRRAWVIGGAVPLALGLIAAAGIPQAATAATSETEEWLSSASPDVEAEGDEMELAFGDSGTTGTLVADTLQDTCTNDEGETYGNPTDSGAALDEGAEGSPSSDANVDTSIEPDPDGTSVSQCVIGAGNANGQIESIVTFSKPVIGPLFHAVNLEASQVTLEGDAVDGSTIALEEEASSPNLEVEGNTLNPDYRLALQGGCDNGDPGGNPNGACGSIRLLAGAQSAPIQGFTMDNNTEDSTLPTAANDGWLWSISFPTVDLTKAFSPGVIQVGDTSELTFTIENANEAPDTMNGISFTDQLPDGVELASAGSTDNGECGAPSVSGTSMLEIEDVDIDAGATCELTVEVTADEVGEFVNTEVEGGVANVIADTEAPLTVTAGPPPEEDDELPDTGAPTGTLVGLSVLLVVGGGMTILLARKGPLLGRRS